MRARLSLHVFLLAVTSLAVDCHAQSVTVHQPDAIAYQEDQRIKGVAVAVLSGDPTQGYYTMRVRFMPNTKVPAHRHPDARTVTVLSGKYFFATGDQFDESALTGYGAGVVIVVPAGVPHFSAARDETTVVQESGAGPTGTTVIGPAQ